jgi:hypothetical protein
MMGAEDIALPARLVRTPKGDELHLSDGQILKLALPTGYSDGQELIVGVATKSHYQTDKQALAKQLLQEILNS